MDSSSGDFTESATEAGTRKIVDLAIAGIKKSMAKNDGGQSIAGIGIDEVEKQYPAWKGYIDGALGLVSSVASVLPGGGGGSGSGASNGGNQTPVYTTEQTVDEHGNPVTVRRVITPPAPPPRASGGTSSGAGKSSGTGRSSGAGTSSGPDTSSQGGQSRSGSSGGNIMDWIKGKIAQFTGGSDSSGSGLSGIMGGIGDIFNSLMHGDIMGVIGGIFKLLITGVMAIVSMVGSAIGGVGSLFGGHGSGGSNPFNALEGNAQGNAGSVGNGISNVMSRFGLGGHGQGQGDPGGMDPVALQQAQAMMQTMAPEAPSFTGGGYSSPTGPAHGGGQGYGQQGQYQQSQYQQPESYQAQEAGACPGGGFSPMPVSVIVVPVPHHGRRWLK